MKMLNQSIDTYFDIKETATTLSVTPATIRNWMKAGKIVPAQEQGNTLLFNKSDIKAIKEDITSGRSHRLKKRRNKKAVMGHFIPTEYVGSKSYLTVAESLLTWIKEKSDSIDDNPAPILYEVILNLLVAKNRIRLLNPIEEKSLTEAVQENRLLLGDYAIPLNDLHNPVFPLSNDTCEILRSIRSLNIPFIEGDDLLGLLYMSLSSLSSRKNKGAYYTPSKIVDQLVEQSLKELSENTLPKIVDPCCGSGNFLIKLFVAIKTRLLENGYDLKDAEKALFTFCLHGYDIDPMAALLARLNLILLLETPYGELSGESLHIRCKNALETHAPSFNEAFDLVIGNPPWGYSYNHKEAHKLRKRFDTASGALESFCLFIEYGMTILKPQGILSYVLPESMLNVQAHEPIRRLLVNQTQICQIDLLGHRFSKVFAPSILFTARKASAFIGGQVRIHHEEKKYTISQNRFAGKPGTIFNVKASDSEQQIIDRMMSHDGVQFLREKADFALGIVTGNNEHFLFNEPTPGAERVLKGGHVFKYNIYPGEHYLVFEPEQFQQVAPEKWYRAPEKLIYRFINESLVFAYDNQGFLSLNSANVVIPRIPHVSIKYILAVLNSRPAQFFHQISYSSVKVLRKHIESIPIPPCTFTEEKRVIQLVDELLATTDLSERTRLYELIDDNVMSLYHLKASDQDTINKKMKQIKFLSR